MQHLCWTPNGFSAAESFWYKINSKMFPKLKHLKIIDDFSSITKVINNKTSDLKKDEIILNIGSLFENDLESLHIEVEGLRGINLGATADVNKNNTTNENENENEKNNSDDTNDENGCSITQFLNLLSEMVHVHSKTNKNKKQLLIIKLGLNATLGVDDFNNGCFSDEKKEYFDQLSLKLLEIYLWMTQNYFNVMLGFRLNVRLFGGARQFISPLDTIMIQRFKDQIVFKSDESRLVNRVLAKNYQNPQVLFGAMIKNNLCQYSHAEPKYEYQCKACKSSPWLQIDQHCSY